MRVHSAVAYECGAGNSGAGASDSGVVLLQL